MKKSFITSGPGVTELGFYSLSTYFRFYHELSVAFTILPLARLIGTVNQKFVHILSTKAESFSS